MLLCVCCVGVCSYSCKSITYLRGGKKKEEKNSGGEGRSPMEWKVFDRFVGGRRQIELGARQAVPSPTRVGLINSPRVRLSERERRRGVGGGGVTERDSVLNAPLVAVGNQGRVFWK